MNIADILLRLAIEKPRLADVARIQWLPSVSTSDLISMVTELTSNRACMSPKAVQENLDKLYQIILQRALHPLNATHLVLKWRAEYREGHDLPAGVTEMYIRWCQEMYPWIDPRSNAIQGPCTPKVVLSVMFGFYDSVEYVQALYAAASLGMLDRLQEVNTLPRSTFLPSQQKKTISRASLLAVRNGHLDCFKYLDDCGLAATSAHLKFDPAHDEVESWTYQYPVETSTPTGYKQIVAEGMIRSAVNSGKLEIVRYLHEEKGFPLEAMDMQTALGWENRHDIVEYMIEKGAPISISCIQNVFHRKGFQTLQYIWDHQNNWSGFGLKDVQKYAPALGDGLEHDFGPVHPYVEPDAQTIWKHYSDSFPKEDPNSYYKMHHIP